MVEWCRVEEEEVDRQTDSLPAINFRHPPVPQWLRLSNLPRVYLPSPQQPKRQNLLASHNLGNDAKDRIGEGLDWTGLAG